MGHIPLLDELAIIAALGALVTVLLARFELPTVTGLLLAGALVGPYGLGFVRSIDAIEVLAEIGVVLLLFSIGLELSIRQLSYVLRRVALGGLLQVGLTIGATATVAVWLGTSASQGLLYGFVVSLSSTAVVLRALTERRELDAPHGRFIVGTLILQDLSVVPMVLLVPLLGSGLGPSALLGRAALAIGKAALVVTVTLVVARLLVPRILRWVDASRSREVFLLAVLALCAGTALLTRAAGLSLALGAFLGGVVVADTEYGHRAMSETMPLRDLFVSLFFVSLGMLFDVRVLLQHPIAVGLLLAAFLVGKAGLASIAALSMRVPARVAFLSGVGLAQFGEFGFVLLRLGVSEHVIDEVSIRPVLVAGILSIFVAPVLLRVAPHMTAGERLLAPLERLLGVRGIDEVIAEERPSNHVVIVGYGVAGRITATALTACAVPHVVLELNAETVRAARRHDLPVYYADATSPEALHHAGLEQARALVLLIDDPRAAERVVDAARRSAPHVPVLLRARYLSNIDGLLRIGAKDVVAEEVEGGVEVLSRLLGWLDVPTSTAKECVHRARETLFAV